VTTEQADRPQPPELGGPPLVVVGVAPNTVMAAGCLLARLAKGGRVKVGDAEAAGQVAAKLAAALERDGWPDAASAVLAAGRADA
jgi:hypothetical protein